jgi:hypothetical protein
MNFSSAISITNNHNSAAIACFRCCSVMGV